MELVEGSNYMSRDGKKIIIVKILKFGSAICTNPAMGYLITEKRIFPMAWTLDGSLFKDSITDDDIIGVWPEYPIVTITGNGGLVH